MCVHKRTLCLVYPRFAWYTYALPGIEHSAWYMLCMVYTRPGIRSAWYTLRLVYALPGIRSAWYTLCLVYALPGILPWYTAPGIMPGIMLCVV
jgi:hypothetical protein